MIQLTESKFPTCLSINTRQSSVNFLPGSILRIALHPRRIALHCLALPCFCIVQNLAGCGVPSHCEVFIPLRVLLSCIAITIPICGRMKKDLGTKCFWNIQRSPHTVDHFIVDGLCPRLRLPAHFDRPVAINQCRSDQVTFTSRPGTWMLLSRGTLRTCIQSCFVFSTFPCALLVRTINFC